MSLTVKKSLEKMLDSDLTLEGRRINEGGDSKVYVVLTNTGTAFSKISKAITGDPYNHISISIDEDMTDMFTFSLFNKNGYSGGFKRETRKGLRGSKYSLYSIGIPTELKERIVDHMKELESGISNTRYGYKSLVNIVFNSKVFDTEENELICSHFVASVFDEVGINLFKNKDISMIKPYEFVKSKLLKFERRGVIK